MANRYEKNGKGNYPCPYCEFESPTPQGIGKHVQMAHGGHAKAMQARPPKKDAALCTEPSQPANNADQVRAMAAYPPITPETQRVRRVCNVAVSLLTDGRYRELPPALKRDVLAVLRMRLAEEEGTAEALMGEMMGVSLDPLASGSPPA